MYILFPYSCLGLIKKRKFITFCSLMQFFLHNCAWGCGALPAAPQRILAVQMFSLYSQNSQNAQNDKLRRDLRDH